MQETAKGAAAISFDDFIDACRGGSLRRIRDALMAGADVNVRNERGMTPLMYFADNPKITRILLNAGADVNARDNERLTALMFAANPYRFAGGAYDEDCANRIEVIGMLLKAGADVDITDVISGASLLERVVGLILWRGHDPETFQILFDAMAKSETTIDLEARDKNGTTLLMGVLEKPDVQPNLVAGLISAGADVNAKGRWGKTALMSVETPELIETLLAAGADVHAKDEDDWTPIMWAIARNTSLDVLQMLIDAGADVNDLNPETASSILMRAVQHWTPKHENILKIIRAGADVNARDDDGMTPLLHAVRNDQCGAKIVAALLDAGADINAKDSNGWTALQTAIRFNDQVIHTLIKAGADVNAKDDSGRTALMLAVEAHQSPRIIQELLNAGADVNAADVYGVTAVMDATEARFNHKLRDMLRGVGMELLELDMSIADEYIMPDSRIIDMLLKAGANVNARSDTGWTPLMLAIKSTFCAQPELIQALLDAGADVNAKSDSNWTPLMIAIAGDANASPELIQILLDAGADPKGVDLNARDEDEDDLRETLLMRIIHRGDLELFFRLIKLGVDVNVRDERGWTPLMIAIADESSPEVIQTLLDAGADLKAMDPNAKGFDGWIYDDETFLMHVMEQGDLEWIPALLGPETDINARDEYGMTALRYALDASEAVEFRVKLLLDAGIDVNARDEDDETALWYAVKRNKAPEVLKLLLDAGADANIENESGQTPLMYVLENKAPLDVIKALLDAGADANVRYKDGRTVLWHVLEVFEDADALEAYGDVQPLIKALLDAGADVNVKNTDGETPLMYAIGNYVSLDVIQTLLNAGADVNFKNAEGKTPLMYALENNVSPEVIQTLLDAGADLKGVDISAWDNGEGDDALKETPLMRVIHRGNLGWVPILIKLGADVNARDEKGRTALSHAMGASKNIEPLVRVLLDAGADITIEDRWGWMPLMFAISDASSPEVIQTLRNAGADIAAINPNARDGSRRTMLMRVLSNLDLSSEVAFERVLDLIRCGANVNIKDKRGWTPLMYALENHASPKVIQTLLDAGAGVNARDIRGWTPLMFAINNYASPEVIQALRDAGAELEAIDSNAQYREGWTPLMRIIHWADIELLSNLIKPGPALNFQNKRGWTALWIALKERRGPEVIQLLLNAGADVNMEDRYGITYLMFALRRRASQEVIQAMLDGGANVKVKDKQGWTPLIYAFDTGASPEVIQALLDAGSDVNIKDEQGWTPLMHAIGNNFSPEVIQTLVDAGADPEAMDPNALGKYNDTFLTRVIHLGNLEWLAHLIKLGADVNVAPKECWTPLMFAIANRASADVIQALLNAGANVNAMDERWGTPLMLALGNHASSEVIQALLDAGADPAIKNNEGKTALDYAKENKDLNASDVIAMLSKAARVERRNKQGAH